MENVILVIHLLLALALIGVVLMQRSEGGGLGMGGGGGGGAVSARSAGTALGKLTWILGVAFICTTLTLTVIAASKASGVSVMDRLGGTAAPAAESDRSLPGLDTDGLLPPPSAGDTGDAPLVPRAD